MQKERPTLKMTDYVRRYSKATGKQDDVAQNVQQFLGFKHHCQIFSVPFALQVPLFPFFSLSATVNFLLPSPHASGKRRPKGAERGKIGRSLSSFVEAIGDVGEIRRPSSSSSVNAVERGRRQSFSLIFSLAAARSVLGRSPIKTA